MRMLTGITFRGVIKKEKERSCGCLDRSYQYAQLSFYTRPAFFSVTKAPFLEIVFKARAVSLTVTKRLSSGTQIRLVFRLGVNNLGVLAVTC